MKSDTALVRSDSRVELYSETSVYLYLAVIVNPWYTENDLSLRLYYSLEYACINKVLSLFSNRLESFKNLCNSLDELFLINR